MIALGHHRPQHRLSNEMQTGYKKAGQHKKIVQD